MSMKQDRTSFAEVSPIASALNCVILASAVAPLALDCNNGTAVIMQVWSPFKVAMTLWLHWSVNEIMVD